MASMLAKLIAAYMEKNKISLRAMAAEIEIPHDALWRFEQGKQIKTAHWTKIVKWALLD